MRNLPYFGWEVNSACNHRCIYCYNHGNRADEDGCYSDDKMNTISDFLVSQHPISVTISGGEALLIFDRLKTHIEKLRSREIKVRILSNGALITDEIARFCAKWDVRFLLSFPSVDRAVFGAVTGRMDSYDKTLAGMDILKEHGVAFQTNTVVVTANLDTVDETVRFLWQRYAPSSVMVSRVTAPAGAGMDILGSILLNQEQLNRMFDICAALSEKEGIPVQTCGGFALCAMNSRRSFEIFGKICGGGKHDCVITNSGDVRVCARDSQVYGNIFREPFEEIRRRMAVWREAPVPKACRKCRMAKRCRGGCHMSSIEPDRGPGSLDCHARPSSVFGVFYRRRRLDKMLRPLHHYQIMPFVAAEESDCVRLSVGIAYGYFPWEVPDYLDSHKEITLLCAWKVWHWNAFAIMKKLLRIGALQE